ncbi:hypothetical protein BJY52DRAFT_1414608 [Lactarius psammicola]|nr:hypothetical protein BJY52DRAFT_1414608 [Lactarius psammicola]
MSPQLSIADIDDRVIRSKTFKKSEDVRYSIECLHYLRGLPFNAFDIPKNNVTELFTEALWLQVQPSARDTTRNMEVVVVLCRELLASNISTDLPVADFTSSFDIDTEHCQEWHDQLVDEVVECLRDAVKLCPPHLHEVYLALGRALVLRFYVTGLRDGYEEAKALFGKIVSALLGAFALTLNRGALFKNPEYIGETTSLCRSMLGCASLPGGVCSLITGVMASHAEMLVEDYGPPDCLQDENSAESEFPYLRTTNFGVVRETCSNAAIKHKFLDLKKLLSNTRPGTPHHSECLDLLAGCYQTKVSRTNDTTDVEESIKYRRLSLDAGDSNNLFKTKFFGSAMRRTNKISYLDEAIALGHDILKLKAQSRRTFTLFGACNMSNGATSGPTPHDASGIPLPLEAYEKAMASMLDSLSFSPTLQTQHNRLVVTDNGCQLEAAIETLEQRRALLWSEMRGLRTPIAKPIEEDLPLAKKLAGGTQGGDGMDALGCLVRRQCKLLEERDALISQIQAFPEFERLWKTSSFTTLRNAASPALMYLLHLFQLPKIISSTVQVKLKEQLLDIRNNHGLDLSKYELMLSTVLSELYRLIDGRCQRQAVYLGSVHLFIYTPTLSALIESRRHDSYPSEKLSLLLVAQPDASRIDAQAEIKVVQDLPLQLTSLISEDATSLAVINGLRGHQLVHFTCHGTLEKAKPFDASFKLHGNDRLTLLEIVRSQLPSAEFAFLAARHTAELTDESIADEGLHLVAAVPYCGFRSVVETMWVMTDIDQSLRSTSTDQCSLRRRKGVPNYESIAKIVTPSPGVPPAAGDHSLDLLRLTLAEYFDTVLSMGSHHQHRTTEVEVTLLELPGRSTHATAISEPPIVPPTPVDLGSPLSALNEPFNSENTWLHTRRAGAGEIGPGEADKNTVEERNLELVHHMNLIAPAKRALFNEISKIPQEPVPPHQWHSAIGS